MFSFSFRISHAFPRIALLALAGICAFPPPTTFGEKSEWEAMLDAIYEPDAFDPEIPFLPEKKPDAEIAAKREAFKTKLRTVSKFKEKARPEEIDKWFSKIMPTATDPLTLSINAELRAEIKKKLKEYESVPALKVFAHPSARFFPGDVPEKFVRIGKTFYPNPQVEGWQSTGLYASPGERVKIHVSKSAVGIGLRLRIGAHTDNLLDSRQRVWRRFPRITREFGVNAQSFEIASPFGGLLYVMVPNGRASGRTQFLFSGAVEAPFFKLGETKRNDWEYVRYAPAPWAEFAGKNFIATLPADEAATVDDPEKIIRFWDDVVAELDKLTAAPAKRSRPVRFVVDVETTAAAGHAGDPIAGTLLWTAEYLDLEKIRRDGAWELFFALGKNAVSNKWTFFGDKDTPAALLALYCMERATGKKAETFFDVPALQSACFARIERENTEEKNKKAQREKNRKEALEKKARERQIIKDASVVKSRQEREKIAKEADVEDEFRDPGVPFQRLSAYIPVVAATGWEPLAKVFKRYTVRNRLPLENDDEKRRTFVMLWSQATKKNLSPFLENFGFPKQGSAGNYAEFMPKNFPPPADLRPKQGGTGFLGDSPFPTIAVLNSTYRVPQITRSTAGENAGTQENSDDEENETDDAEKSESAESEESDAPADGKPPEEESAFDEDAENEF